MSAETRSPVLDMKLTDMLVEQQKDTETTETPIHTAPADPTTAS